MVQETETDLAMTEPAGDSPPRLTEKQGRALAMRVLMGDASHREVAEAIGISHTSISVWMRSEWFARMWGDAGSHVQEIADAARISGGLRSLYTLIDAQTDPESSVHDRIDAAARFLTLEQRRREHEAEPARMALGAQLAVWARRSREILDLPAIPPAGDTTTAPDEDTSITQCPQGHNGIQT